MYIYDRDDVMLYDFFYASPCNPENESGGKIGFLPDGAWIVMFFFFVNIFHDINF